MMWPKQTYKLLIILLLLLPAGVFAQDYTAVDSKIKKYPKAFTSIDKLANRINQDFVKEDEKARAIYTWMALNIKYDIPTWLDNNHRPYADDTELAQRVFLERKAVCQGYSILYKILGEKAGLEVVVITGYSKVDFNDIAKPLIESDHAWNAVKIAGQWKLIDTTWGAGYRTNESKPKFVAEYDDTYFFTNPDKFFLKHFPEDKKWLLTDKTEKNFIDLPLYYDLRYEILAPIKGFLRASKVNSVEFKVNGIKEGDSIYYSFEGDEYSTEAQYTLQNGIAVFLIPITKESAGELSLSVNFDSLASFKIYEF